MARAAGNGKDLMRGQVHRGSGSGCWGRKLGVTVYFPKNRPRIAREIGL